MCLFGFFKKKNENRPAGVRIADAAFSNAPAGRSPSEHERALYALFAKEPISLTAEERALRAETEEAFLKAGQLIGKFPVDIGTGSALPLALAKFLAIRGFVVRYIRADGFDEAEKADYAWLGVHFPDIRIVKENENTAALYLDGREPVAFQPETESLKALAERMTEKAGGMHFII